jgi:mRNA-degrading endonuclease toxin of MazEF toxin-antitoxin module
MKRGDLYWADLIPRSGSEQTGRRPVIIVSHDGFNHTPGWRSIIVVPISTVRVGPSQVVDLVWEDPQKGLLSCFRVAILASKSPL